MSKKYLELAKKIKALADQGEGGEKLNAKAYLEKLMQEHNISFQDLEEEDMSDHYFSVLQSDKDLFIQVASTVLGRSFPIYKVTWKKKLILKTTAINAIEIEAKFRFFKHAYEKELKIFFHAFIIKNGLTPKDNNDTRTVDDLTEEELEHYREVFKMSEKMNRHNYNKQLNNSESRQRNIFE